MPKMGSGRCRQVGLKGRPLCAGVSVTRTMRLFWRRVDGGPKIYISGHLPCSLSFRTHVDEVPENVFRSFHEGIHHVSNENQKPVAPGTTKVEPATAQPAPQQNQGDAKPNTDKPAGQQK